MRHCNLFTSKNSLYEIVDSTNVHFNGYILIKLWNSKDRF